MPHQSPSQVDGFRPTPLDQIIGRVEEDAASSEQRNKALRIREAKRLIASLHPDILLSDQTPLEVLSAGEEAIEAFDIARGKAREMQAKQVVNITPIPSQPSPTQPAADVQTVSVPTPQQTGTASPLIGLIRRGLRRERKALTALGVDPNRQTVSKVSAIPRPPGEGGAATINVPRRRPDQASTVANRIEERGNSRLILAGNRGKSEEERLGILPRIILEITRRRRGGAQPPQERDEPDPREPNPLVPDPPIVESPRPGKRRRTTPRPRQGQFTSTEEDFLREIDNVVDTQRDSIGIVSRAEFGDIWIEWGRIGDPAKDFAGGSGLAKIIAKRNQEFLEGKIDISGDEWVRTRLPKVLAKGKPTFQGSGLRLRAKLELNGDVVILRLFHDGDRRTCLLTGFPPFK